MSKNFIYHGSYTRVLKPKIISSKYTKDFGPGFYCTTIKEQAIRWAKRYESPILNIYSYLIDDNLNILEFENMTDKWLDFIVSCRAGKTHNYDIVIGAVANDQIYNYVSDFIDGAITRNQFWSLAKFKYPTNQINFCSNKALKSIKFFNSAEV